MTERIQRQRRAGESPDQPDAPLLAPQAAPVDLDALLDEIDSVLESDAEAYVRGFVQKGGQ